MTAVIQETTSRFLAVPFETTPKKVKIIINECVEHPWWFNAPCSDEERAFAIGFLIHDPQNRVWEVWEGGYFVGLILLQRIQPRVDALLHFVFFDQNLINKRSLLLGFLGCCYHSDEFGFERISFEVPEFRSALVGFARRKLGFTFEGESVVRQMVVQHGLRLKDPYRANHKESLDVIVAGAGSRREAAHWHKGQWHDVLCLKQTKAEYDRFMEGSRCPSR